MNDTLTELRKLPALLAMVNAWEVRKSASVELLDWYTPIEKATILIDRYIGDELKAAEPETWEACSWLLSDGNTQWDLCAALLTLEALQAHPELMPLLVERLKTAIVEVLEGKADPEH